MVERGIIMKLVKCISEREPSLLSLIEVGKIYYLDETYLYVDSDGDEYAKIYKDKWRKEYIGNMLTKHFCEPIFCDWTRISFINGGKIKWKNLELQDA